MPSILDSINPISAGAGVLQAGIGAIQSISANKRLKRLFAKRTTYVTPEEIHDQTALAENQAQTGYGAQTMAYLTNQNDRSLTGALSALTRLGGDANDIANVYDRSFQNIFKTAAGNEELQMQKFAKLSTQLGVEAQNKTAEWASKEALLKDQIAMEADKAKAGQQNLQSGLNLGLSAIAQGEQADLYKQANGLGKYAKPITTGSPLDRTQEVMAAIAKSKSTLPNLPSLFSIATSLPQNTSLLY